MINQVSKIFTDLSDSELRQVLIEMREDDPQGIIRSDGIFRAISKKVMDVTKENFSSTIPLVLINIYKEAAYRFSGV